jgi:mono/diheme cytochrome c family protein
MAVIPDDCTMVAERGNPRKAEAVRMPGNYPVQWRVAALAAILLCASESTFAQSPSERRGFRFIRVHCAECHAIDKVGESPLANAPPFRTLHLKHPVADLQRPFVRGIHPNAPKFQLEFNQVEDIMTYLKTLER